MTDRLEPASENRLIALADALVDQRAAGVAVPPMRAESGYWFGGGNVIRHTADEWVLVGRYRNQGDSRTGIGVGERGLELAFFRSADGGRHFSKWFGLNKHALSVDGRSVLSIEGAALRRHGAGVELFVSTEKSGIGYPPGLESFQKPGTGVWTIDRLVADSIEGLRDGVPETVLASTDPRYWHVKDPVPYETAGGDLALFFCSHPFCWTSSNSGYAIRPAGSATFGEAEFECLPRGATWDVAISRITSLVDVPEMGPFRDRRVTLVFYDGGECVRPLEEHATAVKRPRGYSCEELGGVGYCLDGRFDRIHRLSLLRPQFVSPYGSGCSRYVDILAEDDGWLVTWQQGQPDGSQPLVAHRLDRAVISRILGGG